MSLNRRNRIIEVIIDPSSGQLSMSRCLLPLVCLLDAAWVYAAAKGLPPREAFAPVSSLLGVITGAISGIYGLNSVGGAVSRNYNLNQDAAANLPYPTENRRRAKPAPDKEGQL